MISSVYAAERVEERNRIIATDVGLPLILATLPDASQEADDIAEYLFERHRGAYADEECGEIVVFGNDGFAEDHRSRMEVAHVVGVSIDLGLILEAFGVCRDGYTWALVFSYPSGESVETLTSALHQAANDAWFEASGVPVPDEPMWAVSPLDSPVTARETPLDSGPPRFLTEEDRLFLAELEAMDDLPETEDHSNVPWRVDGF